MTIDRDSWLRQSEGQNPSGRTAGVMQAHRRTSSGPGGFRLGICWGLGALWAVSCAASALTLGSPLGAALWAVQLLLLFVIALLHSSILYGWAGTLAYLVIGLAISFTFEAMSVAFGFPYGSYVHHSPGPRVLDVPLQAIFIYLVYGWYAWILARLLCLETPGRLTGAACLTVPLCGGFILAGYDYPIDPIMASVAHLWTFTDPSGQFGVPLTNFLGWILTGWAIFLPMALLERRFSSASSISGRGYWLLPCLIWIFQAVQFVILWMQAPVGEVVTGTRRFVASDIFEAAVAASLFTVLFVGLVGLARLYPGRQD